MLIATKLIKLSQSEKKGVNQLNRIYLGHVAGMSREKTSYKNLLGKNSEEKT